MSISRWACVLLVGGFAGSAARRLALRPAAPRRPGRAGDHRSPTSLLLGTLGVLMLVESTRAILRRRRPGGPRRKLHQHNWLHGLPLKMRFRRSKLYISALLPLGLGFVVGILSAIMGVGGGFVMVPAMIYMLGMPTAVVPGTSLFQIIFVAANVTVLQAVENRTVDVVLALVLLVGGVHRRAARHAASARGCAASSCARCSRSWCWRSPRKLAFDLTVPPDRALFSLETIGA